MGKGRRFASCEPTLKRIKISLYEIRIGGTGPMAAPAQRPFQVPFATLNVALKAAGEETRLRILALLSEAELTVSELTDILRQSQPRISRHLRLLAEAGLVDRFREGSWAFFRLGERGAAAELARSLVARLDPA